MNKIKISFISMLFFQSYQSMAQDFKNEISFKTDNDAYLWNRQDRYYTNGLFIYFRRVLDSLHLGKNIEKIQCEISIGQKIFNPISGYRPDPNTQDRPFAGYLYASISTSIASKSENIFKGSLEIGVVGPKAYGKEVQTLLHRIACFYKIQGWQYQIQHATAINISAQFSKLLQRADNQKVDFSIDSHASLGTTFTGAGIGLLLRAGDINQLFNSSSTNLFIGRAKTSKITRDELFFYAKPQLNYVAYDATISGNLFNKNSLITFDTKPIVFEQQFGIKYSATRFTLDYHLIFKSREIKSTAKAHQYGGISMYYRFN